MTLCSVIVLTYNSGEYIGDCLDTVLDQSFKREYEVLVADNDSSDNTTSIVSENYPEVTLVSFDRNWGTAAGYNRAFDKTKGDYVVYLNPDTIVHYRWLESLVAAIEETDAAAAHSCVIEPYHCEFDEMDRRAEPERRVVFDLNKYGFVEDKYVDTTRNRTLFLSATSMIIRRDVTEQLEYLFDPDLPMYGDDLDLALRLNLHGYDIIHAPDSIVYHRQYQKVQVDSTTWILRKYVWVTTSRSSAFFKSMSFDEYARMLPRLLVSGVLSVRILRLPTRLKLPAYIASMVLSILCLAYSFLVNRHLKDDRKRLLEARKKSVYTQMKQLVE